MPRKPTHLAAAERALRDLMAALDKLEPAGCEAVRLAEVRGGWYAVLQFGHFRKRWADRLAEQGPPRRPPAARSQCREDIMAAVAAGRPMTRGEVVMAVARAGREYSSSTVGKALAELTAEKRLVNDGGGRGYFLPEWVAPPAQARLFAEPDREHREHD